MGRRLIEGVRGAGRYTSLIKGVHGEGRLDGCFVSIAMFLRSWG